jgi:hypothetical protein
MACNLHNRQRRNTSFKRIGRKTAPCRVGSNHIALLIAFFFPNPAASFHYGI